MFKLKTEPLCDKYTLLYLMDWGERGWPAKMTLEGRNQMFLYSLTYVDGACITLQVFFRRIDELSISGVHWVRVDIGRLNQAFGSSHSASSA